MRRHRWRKRFWGLGLATALFVADQVTKWYVVERLDLRVPGDHYPLLPFFDLTRTNNYGVSLGLFTASSDTGRWILVVMTALIAGAVLVWMLRERRLPDILGLAMILGGALGNSVDRFRFGYVVDFADFHIGTFRPFLIFNVADAAITIGVVILLARALFIREKTATEHSETV